MPGLKNLVGPLLGDGFTEFHGALREYVRDNQHNGEIRLMIQGDGNRFGVAGIV